jgi:flagellin-like hook-associated protein FlgL
LEAHYQNEIESIKGEVTRLADLLEQVLSSKNGKGIFAQPLVKTSSIHIPGTSQNLGADSTAEQHFVSIAPIPSSQAPITVDLTADGPPGNRSTNFVNYDKLSALKERLRAVDDND